MKCVYVLMMHPRKSAVGPDKKEYITSEPYAVFEDSITAERMKRDGDEIVKVPYFEDKSNKSDWYTTSPNSINVVPCNDHTSITYQGTDPWGKESTTLAPPYNTYPRVTCSNKTVDEHTWANRSD